MTLTQAQSNWHVPGITLIGPSRLDGQKNTNSRYLGISPLICNLWHTVATDIILPMGAVTIDVTHVEVAVWFGLAKIAIYRSSTGVVTLGQPAMGLQTTVCVVLKCFHQYEITEWWMAKKRATSVIDCPASMCPTARQGSEFSIRFLEVIETHMSWKTNCTKVLNTFYQHLQSTSVTLHKAGIL